MNRSERLWFGINRRCDPDSDYVKSRPTYQGCRNEFTSFAEFKQWAESQTGFYKKDGNGKLWQVDKDLLCPGSRIYSSHTCLFVPAKINSLMLCSNSAQGEWPLGVYLDRCRNRWKAQCSNGDGHSSHVGYFRSPMDAHKAWQQRKASVVMGFAETDDDVKSDPRIQVALKRIAETIMCDLVLGRETFAMTHFAGEKI